MISARTIIVPSKMEAIARPSTCPPLELSGVAIDGRRVSEVTGGRVVGSVGNVKVPRNKTEDWYVTFYL